MRFALAVLLGLVVGSVFVAIGETISSSLYPPPAGLDLTHPEDLSKFIESLPPGAFILVLLAHADGAFAGAAVCQWISKSNSLRGAMTVGTLFLIAGIGNLVTIPHPVWFAVLDLLIYLPLAWFGGMLARAIWTAGQDEPSADEPHKNESSK